MSNKKYVDAAYCKGYRGTSENGKPYIFVKMGVKKEDFIKEIQSIPANEKGFIDFRLSPHLKDPSRWSMAIDDWKPTQGKSSSTPKIDDLPF